MQDEPDEMPRVTVSMLRRAEQMCRRRLQREHTSRKSRANPASDARFAVSSRIAGDARLAQSEAGAPRREAFVDPLELEPEQRQLYAAAAQGYLGSFGAADGRVIDLGWTTTFTDLGVVLVANVGLPVELPDEQRELRVLHLGLRSRARGLLDPVTINVALLRTEDWARDQLRIVAADLIDNDLIEHSAELPEDREAAHAWFVERVEVVRELALDGRPRAGTDCLGCAFVAGCEPHRAS